MKYFELWLDESGTFEDGGAARRPGDIPSLVGGVLIEKSRREVIDLSTILTDQHLNHATNLTFAQKKAYCMPKLIELRQQTEARFVFFENLEHVGEGDDRKLYLQVLNEGLLQLAQLLDARYNGVNIEVLIASRSSSNAQGGRSRTKEEEYQAAFNQLRQKRISNNELMLNLQTQLSFRLARATEVQELIFADFACNTRFHYRRSVQGGRSARNLQADRTLMRLFQQIFDEALLFSMNDLSSDTRIRILLADNDISEVIMELFTSRTIAEANFNEYLNLLIAHLSHMNYRWIKSQLRQAGQELLADIAKEDDYTQAAKYLEKINQTLIPRLEAEGYPVHQFKFELLLQLTDMYLRSGNLGQALNTLAACKQAEGQADNSLEEVFNYYRLLEKTALFAIDAFQFEKGADLMRETASVFSEVLSTFEAQPLIQARFPSMKSEYYGDALCMEIYALMFLQRSKPELYEDLVSLSDLALKQYPSSEGELERHRQYRSRIELQAGHFERALHWLISAELYDEVISDEISSEARLIEFLDRVCRVENEISVQFYLMYYMLIMSEARNSGPSELSHLMIKVLRKHRILFMAGVLKQPGQQTLEVQDAFHQPHLYQYHPMDIVYWKLGNFYKACKKYSVALQHYSRALAVCRNQPQAISLQLTAVGILAAKSACEKLNKQPIESYKMLKQQLNHVIKLIDEARVSQVDSDDKFDLQPTLDMVMAWQQAVELANQNGKISSMKLWQLSQTIFY